MNIRAPWGRRRYIRLFAVELTKKSNIIYFKKHIRSQRMKPNLRYCHLEVGWNIKLCIVMDNAHDLFA
jgi:hypothetical protein